MSNISVDFDVLNQRGSPAWFTDTFANIPTAGFVGRMFISKDTFAFYRDTGSGWDLIGGPGIGTLTGSGVVGQVSFFNGTQVLAGNNNLFWDNTNSRLGINTTTPGAPLDIHATGTNAQFNGTGTSNAYLTFQNAGVSKWRIGNTYSAGANTFDIFDSVNSFTILSITNSQSITFFGINSSQFAFSNGKFSATRTSAAINLTFSAENRQTPAADVGSSLGFYGGSTGNDGIAEIYGAWEGASTNNGYFAIQTATSGTRTEKFRINSSGFVGINTLTPTFFLDVTGNGRFTSNLTALSFIKSGGTSAQFLKADGSIDSTTYLSTTAASTTYLPLAGGTLSGALNIVYASPYLQLSAQTGGSNILNFLVNNVVVGNLTINASFYQFTNYTSSGWLFKNSVGTNVLAIDDAGVSIFNSSISATSFNGTTASKFATSSGNVLIGTNTDNGQKLQVTGQVRASGAINLNTSDIVYATGTTTIFTITSEVNSHYLVVGHDPNSTGIYASAIVIVNGTGTISNVINLGSLGGLTITGTGTSVQMVNIGGAANGRNSIIRMR